MGCREEKNFLTTRKKYIKYSFFYKGYFMVTNSSFDRFPNLSEKLQEVANAHALVSAYPPRQILEGTSKNPV